MTSKRERHLKMFKLLQILHVLTELSYNTSLNYHFLGCLAGFYGTDCFKNCDNGFYGERCSYKCKCTAEQFCHHITGCIFGKYFILIFSLVSDSKCFFFSYRRSIKDLFLAFYR